VQGESGQPANPGVRLWDYFQLC